MCTWEPQHTAVLLTNVFAQHLACHCMGLRLWAERLALTCCCRLQVVVAQLVTLFKKVELLHRHLQRSKHLSVKSHSERWEEDDGLYCRELPCFQVKHAGCVSGLSPN